MFKRFAKQAFQQLRAAQAIPSSGNWCKRTFFIAATATATALACNTMPSYA